MIEKVTNYSFFQYEFIESASNVHLATCCLLYPLEASLFMIGTQDANWEIFLERNN